jgi:hypothetical protein
MYLTKGIAELSGANLHQHSGGEQRQRGIDANIRKYQTILLLWLVTKYRQPRASDDCGLSLWADGGVARVVESTAFADNAAAFPEAQTHYRISSFEH